MAASLAQTCGSLGACPCFATTARSGASAPSQTRRPLIVPNPAWVGRCDPMRATGVTAACAGEGETVAATRARADRVPAARAPAAEIHRVADFITIDPFAL